MLTTAEQKNVILSILADILSDVETIGDYFDHIQFDLGAISFFDDIPAAFLGHYRVRNGHYDVDLACNHLASWPPIAEHILKLTREKEGL